MVRALLDTSILIDHLNAVPAARDELGRCTAKAISIVTWMKVMVGAAAKLEEATRSFLDAFDIVHLDQRVAQEAVELRKAHRMKLPDAIVWASARTHGMILVTRNTKDFPGDDPGVHAPYVLRAARPSRRSWERSA
jgi:predicted nucleic acid-binding protein